MFKYLAGFLGVIRSTPFYGRAEGVVMACFLTLKRVPQIAIAALEQCFVMIKEGLKHSGPILFFAVAVLFVGLFLTQFLDWALAFIKWFFGLFA